MHTYVGGIRRALLRVGRIPCRASPRCRCAPATSRAARHGAACPASRRMCVLCVCVLRARVRVREQLRELSVRVCVNARASA